MIRSVSPLTALGLVGLFHTLSTSSTCFFAHGLLPSPTLFSSGASKWKAYRRRQSTTNSLLPSYPGLVSPTNNANHIEVFGSRGSQLNVRNRRSSQISRVFGGIVLQLASRDDVESDAGTGTQEVVKTIDRAPCFDGVCDSTPIDASDAGTLEVSNSDSAIVFPEIKLDTKNRKANTDKSDSRRTTGATISDVNRNDEEKIESSNPSGAAGEAVLRLGTMTGPTVWSEFGRISQEHDVANLGQGFPDWLPPDFAVESLVSATMDTTAQSPHQYTRTAGHPNLVRQLSRRYSKHMQRNIDPMNEVAVTVGASQALYLCLQTLVKPGDEVILFEPFFDLYVNQIKLAGGTPVYVPLTFVPYDNGDGKVTGGEWKLEPKHLETAISSKTRAIILNSPHNPTGKVFTRSEMEHIAKNVISAGPQCVVISDEVYKYIVHSAPPEEELAGSSCPGHVHFASLPNMWDRTITVSSAGKTFSATGWQVGWCIAPSHLISPIHQLLPYVQFCASTVIQEALARTLPRADEPYEGYDSYYEYLNSKYRRKRDLLGNALKEAGFAIPDYDTTPGGGFFIFARITPELMRALPPERLEPEYTKNSAAPGGEARLDWLLCQWMAEEKGVLCIPSSPFFSREKAVEGASDEFIRVAFCKTDETILKAAAAFKGLKADEPVVASEVVSH